MKPEEIAQVLIAVIMLFIVSGMSYIISGESRILMYIILFSFIVIFVHVFIKKWTAFMFDSSVEHKIWHVYRIGWREHHHFRKELPFGIIIPLIFSAFSLGTFKLMTFLTYETRALKHRAAKRFGYYSFTEITDWDNGLIGAAGIVSLLVLSIIGYVMGYELLFKMAAFYALMNMLPISNLDGTQIFFGSRIIWSVLALICLIFGLYAFALVI